MISPLGVPKKKETKETLRFEILSNAHSARSNSRGGMKQNTSAFKKRATKQTRFAMASEDSSNSDTNNPDIEIIRKKDVLS